VNSVLSVSLLAGALAAEDRSSLRLMVSQPMCGGLCAGLLLGSVRDGFLAGALLQMLFLGMVMVRGLRVPDLSVGGVSAAALYILTQRATGSDPAAKGLTLFVSLFAALGAALIGGAVHRLWERYSSFLAPWALRLAERGRFQIISALHFSTLAVHGIVGCAVVAGAVMAGVPLAASVIGAAPAGLREPLVPVSVLVPFVGAGSLLLLSGTRVRLFLFGAGFAIVLVIMLFRS
jgi:mannose/fructose/N-acetylgalactosamine-specific phosphotransferase system component IIC